MQCIALKFTKRGSSLGLGTHCSAPLIQEIEFCGVADPGPTRLGSMQGLYKKGPSVNPGGVAHGLIKVLREVTGANY